MLIVGLSGYGKMGQEIEKLILKNPKKYKKSGVFSSKSTLLELEMLCKNSDIIIDFSNVAVLTELLEYAILHKTKLVIGTTGLQKKHFDLLKKCAKKITIFYAANTSLGANLLALLASKTASILGKDYDIEILDIHHRDKKDAPSGTALMIGNTINEKTKTDIHFSSMRVGGVFGEHKVLFASKDEVISITHQALNRTIFASGAIKACEWIKNKPAGLYNMKNLIRL